MSRQFKCSYCRNVGHNIAHCSSEEGKIFFNNIRSKAIVYIVLENRSIHERAKLFHQFLTRICDVEELKLLLSKIQCRVNGNRIQLAARFVHSYFIRELALRQFNSMINDNDHCHIRAYLTYWKDLSQGIPLDEANYKINHYFDFMKQFENDNKYKFPINVVMKTVDLTEEEPNQYFECAICMEEQCHILDQVEMECNHSFCTNCVSTMLINSQNKKKHPCCALCRVDFKKIQVHTHKIMEDYNTRFCYSC
jgi:hypothetical protein